MIRLILALVFTVVSSPFISTQASADVLEWRMSSDYQYIVYVRFFSQRYNRAWPGGNQSYVLDDSDTHLMRLECETGEKICFGGFTKSERTTWGVGPYGKGGCDSCCRTCGDWYDAVDSLY